MHLLWCCFSWFCFSNEYMSNSSSGRYVAKYVWTIIHDGIDNILMCMAEWCFVFLKWWIMGFDISCLATTDNFTQWLQGGGLYLSSSSSATITGSTISHNSAVRDVWCVSLMWNAMKLTKFWYAWVNGVLLFWNDGWWDATFRNWQLLVISSWLRCHLRW